MHTRIELPASPEAVPRTRAAVREAFDGWPGASESDVVLVADELVSGTVRTTPPDAERSLTLEIDVVDGRLRITIESAVDGFVPPDGTDREIDALSFLVVERLIDRWGLEAADGATRTWVEFRAA